MYAKIKSALGFLYHNLSSPGHGYDNNNFDLLPSNPQLLHLLYVMPIVCLRSSPPSAHTPLSVASTSVYYIQHRLLIVSPASHIDMKN